ncbi:DUF3500 domain-containing protein [Pricia antarctica]|nr:DUF3500 domain-containing protein [Pricia antarctica]
MMKVKINAHTIKQAAFTMVCLFLLGKAEAQDISKKANAFLQTLSQELKEKTLFTLEDEERYNMNYVPMPREGVTFHDFDETQKRAALDLLKACLSKQGYEKTLEIRSLENVLRTIENDDNDKMPDGRPRRDPLNYHFCIFGTPSPTEVWGWRFEGHHISLNFTSDDGKIVSATPTFLGSNPGIVKEGDSRGKQVLKKESMLGFALVNSLTADQLKIAKFSEEAPPEIITANHREAGDIEKEGIAYGKLDQAQKKTFMKLLQVYVGNYIFDFSETLMAKIEKAGIENLHFAWAGSLKEGKAHYYRIHGPMLLIEFDNTQNDANHMHTAVRDLTNDFAEDILKRHYEMEHR